MRKSCMIEKIKIENFKCFQKIEMDFKKLNVLTGENSSGKSSIIQAILFLLQSIESDKDSVLNGCYVKLGNYNDVKNIFTREKLNIEAVIGGRSLGLERGEKEKKFHDIIYLSANRIGVKNEYERNEEELERIGIFGEYAFDYLSRYKMENMREPDFMKEENVGRNLGNQVDYWLKYFSGYTVKAEGIEGTSVIRVSYQNEESTKEIRTIHVGTGVSYLATIIIAALSCTKESLLIIENPEIHLHPRAQSKFTEFFTFLASRGLQVIIETHSDHIINGIRKEIKRKKIDREDVAIFFMCREEEGVIPEEIEINKNGVILNPKEGFFDQFDDDLDILLGLD